MTSYLSRLRRAASDDGGGFAPPGLLDGYRRKKAEEDAARREALSRNWSLMLDYGNALHDDESQHDASSPEPEKLNAPDPEGLREHRLRSTIASVQTDVVGWIEVAMDSWLRYYFRIEDGPKARVLQGVAETLEKNGHQLRLIGDQLEGAGQSMMRDDLVIGYAKAVYTWASALELIAKGCRLDVFSMAEAGLERLDEAASIADRFVKMPRHSRPSPEVSKALRVLDELAPPAKAPKKSIEMAKSPWRRSLLSAGAPLRWLGNA